MIISDTCPKSIGSFIAEKIVDLAQSLDANKILDEISIYGSSNKDESAVIALEWHGVEEAKDYAYKVLDFLEKIKTAVIGTGKEAAEQVPPHVNIFKGEIVVLYRFRIWDSEGKYEVNEQMLVAK